MNPGTGPSAVFLPALRGAGYCEPSDPFAGWKEVYWQDVTRTADPEGNEVEAAAGGLAGKGERSTDDGRHWLE